jgi:hypothetical protein
MSLDILDMEGNKVISLDPGKQKGINIVRWSYTGKAPKVAKGKTFAFGGFGAPRVPAGTYQVLIKKGKEQYESTIELVYDQRSEIPLESRKAQEKMSRELAGMTQDLAYLVYQVDHYLDFAEKIKANDPKSAKSMTTFTNELNKLKERLVITTGDNYVDTADPELREKISQLYGVVISNYDKPSAIQEETKNTLDKTLKDSQKSFESIIAKHQKNIDKSIKSANLEFPKMDDFTTFVEK